MNEQERCLLATGCNDPFDGDPALPCVHELFEEQVARTPDAIALKFGAQRLTYRELDQRANQLAHHLKRLGVGPEVPVGICVERSLEMVVGMLGILKAGGAYVPMDPAYPSERLAFMLEDTRTPVLLTQQRLVTSLPEHGARVVLLDADRDSIAREDDENGSSGATADNLAYVIFTSGSTGSPKGVQIEHGSLVHLLKVIPLDFQFGPRDVWTAVHSYAFDVSGWEIWGCLCSGGRLIVVPREVTQSPAQLAELLRAEQVTVLHQTPSALRALIYARETADDGPMALRLVVSGGEALPSELATRLLEWGVPAWNWYGPTEATIWSTIHPITASDAHSAVVPIGRPLSGYEAYVLDANLQPVPVGEPGELHIGGVCLARGYLNRPERTAESFIPHPFREGPAARLYKTGDLARYRADGSLEYLGRIDHQVKIRGFRIELGEIQTALEQHPAVRESVVIAREDTPGDPRLVAYLVPQNGSLPAVSELRHYLAGKLPEYMVPSALVRLEALPLTPNGKVDRRALPPPCLIRSESSRPYVAPRDGLEVRLTQMWEEVFGVYPISLYDNFFELGGHSLLAARLFTEIEQVMGRRLPLSVLFEAPTIDQLAARLREAETPARLSPVVPIQPHGQRLPFFCVHGVGGNVLNYSALARHLGPDQPLYGLQSRGVDGRGVQRRSLEEMAADYIAEMRSVQQQGPYALGGHSYGGIVAFEMARQLHAQGLEVALLAILDSDSPLKPDRLDLFKRLLGHLNVLRRFDTRGKLAYLTTRTRAVVRKRLRRAQWQLVHAFSRRLGRPLSEQLQDVEQLNLQALAEYEPRPYPGRLVLFRAGERWVEGARNPAEEWAQLATGGIDIVEVPGDHLTILEEPQVQTLARKLRVWLERGHETHRPDRAAGHGLRARRGGSSRTLRAQLLSFFLGSLLVL